MYKDELRMSPNVDEQPPGSTLQTCLHRGTGLVVFVHAPNAPHCPHVHVLEGGVVIPVARHLEAPDLVRNVLESVAWNWISVHHDGFCSFLVKYTVWLAQTVSK